MRLIAKRKTAMVSRGGYAQEASGTEFSPELMGEGIGFVGFGGQGFGDLAADEFLDGGAEVGEV